MKPLNLPRQYQNLRTELRLAVGQVFASGQFIGGEVVHRFEAEWARYLKASFCVGLGSGTDALTLALQAAGVKGEVIVPANSAFPTAEAVVRAGARPVFCDCDPETYTLDVAHAQSLLGPDIEAIIPVHLYGQPCDMQALDQMATKAGLFVLEDCAHAHGALYDGEPVGTFGDAAAWSFNPTKILGAAGDAGAVTTDDPGLAFNVRQLADHGRLDKSLHEQVGHNSRLDALQAAVLSVKLPYLENWVAHRRRLAGIYCERLRDKVDLPAEADWAKHAYHQFVVRLNNRDKVRTTLFMVYGIETGVHYPLALDEQPALKEYARDALDTEVARAYSRRVLSLPVNESMYAAEAHAVCDSLLEVLE